MTGHIESWERFHREKSVHCKNRLLSFTSSFMNKSALRELRKCACIMLETWSQCDPGKMNSSTPLLSTLLVLAPLSFPFSMLNQTEVGREHGHICAPVEFIKAN